MSATPEAPVDPVAPEPPASVTVTRGDGVLNASWPAVEGATSYHVTYSSDNGASWSLAAERHPETSIEITGVDNALTYVVGVRARNEAGDSGWINSPPAGPFSAEPPATPSSVTVTRGDGTLNASWPAVEGATSYHVTYSSDNGASWSLAALHHPDTSIEITGVDNALTYIVGVRARNAHGDSGWRNSPPAEPADKSPQFGQASIGDLRLEQGKAMDPVTLPTASGGNGPLSYALSGELPAGLAFDASTRVLSGRPARAMAPRRFEYTATDADASEPDVARLSFGITVAVSAEDKAVVEDALAAQGRAMLTGVTSVIGERFRTLSDNAREDIRPDLDRDPTTAALNTLATWLSGHAGSACQPTRGAGLPWERGRPALDEGPTRTCLVPSLPKRPLANDTHSSASAGLSQDILREGGHPALRRGLEALGPPMCDGGSAMNAGPELNLGDLISGRSFAMPLNGGRLTLWSTAGYQGFDSNQFGGGVSSLYFGADKRFGTNWLAGAALSLSRGESGYSAPGREGSLKTRLLSLHPYVRGEIASGMQLWAIGGFGLGKAEDAIGASFGASAGTQFGGAGVGANIGVGAEFDPDAGIDAETARLGMTMLAAGLRQPLRAAGAFEFSLLGEAGRLSLRADEGEGYRAVDGLGVAVSQGRLAMEVTHKRNRFSPYLRVGARTDGGSGLTGTGMEVAGGLRYAGEWIEFEAQARWLAAHSESSHKEYGGNARLILKSRPDGAGLRLSLSPSWGQAAGEAWLANGNGLLGGPSAGARALAGASAAGMGAGGPRANASALSLDGKLEYGLAWHRLKGLLTPMLAYTSLPTGARTVELGFAYQSRDLLPGELALELAVGHETRALLAPADHTARLTLSLRPGGTEARPR